jgi:glycosyltransferase involved in cell wall biosynthesis
MTASNALTAESDAVASLDVICPVYCEADSIESFHGRLVNVLADLSGRYRSRVLYIVDPSDDDTVKTIRKLAENDRNVASLVMSARFGHQMALVAGMDHANADAVIMLDSDLQHPPELIPTLLGRFEDGFDVVQTVRTSTQDQRRLSATSSKVFYALLNRMSDIEIVEGGADFRLLSRRVVRVFTDDIRERNQFLRGLVPWVGFPATTVEFVAESREAGKSKYSFRRSLRFALDGLLSFSKTPLRLGIGLGFFFAFVAFAYALVSAIAYVTAGSIPSGWTSLAMLVAGFSGVLLVFMGILGLYIGAIFDEVKGRPHYIVDERINL